MLMYVILNNYIDAFKDNVYQSNDNANNDNTKILFDKKIKYLPSIMKNRLNELFENNIEYQVRQEIKTIYDFPYTAAVARVLKDLDFPADKPRIIQHIELKRTTMPESNEVLSVLQQIEEKEYNNNIAEVTKAASLVEG
jgi:hypothetical protein